MATERRRSNANGEVYADNAMTWLLGDHAKARILTVLVGKEYRELTAEQVCDLAGIHEESFEDCIEDILDLNVATRTESDDGEELYQLNPESDVADDLKRIRFDLLSAVGDDD